jgi:wyosine [tRNA(Phe)-imidazoG37] synthetase (radical SAM superfamily)
MTLMAKPQFKHIYGPVHSWRMGMSLGLDPISTTQKICNFNCTYCQLGCLGSADAVSERRVFIPVMELVEELKALDTDVAIDYMTFSGNGEPTLAANLGEMIQAVKVIRADRVRPAEKIAIITNGTLLGRKDVQADLRDADLVLVKLEAADERIFQAVNRPAAGVSLACVIAGIKEFKATFKGRFALQVMFVEDNKSQAQAIARLAQEIGADEVQINTPLRKSFVKPLSPAEMLELKKFFAGQNVRSVYEEDKKDYHPFDEQATVRRHGQFKGQQI